ncbi:MAG: S8 family serine peptidase [Candidatus Avoscillospira sp.]
MKKHLPKRLLSLLLALVLCVGLVAPAAAAESEENAQPQVSFEKVDNSEVTAELVKTQRQTQDFVQDEPEYRDTDVVRVSIVLYGKSTLECGYSTEDIASNAQAMSYRSALEQKQETVEKSLTDMLGELDVVWNLTLAANIISANVQYGQIAAIESHSSVKEVVIETCYAPAVVDDDLGSDPNMATSGVQIGRGTAYDAGYYGAGSRIAIIDTGTDVEHISFNGAAFDYALSQYDTDFDLLDADEIGSVLTKLNAYKRWSAKYGEGALAASDLYLTSKLPYAFNYVDTNLNVSHLRDAGSEHGSHVAGIATANRYVADSSSESGFANALETVHVQGVAPDAQLITMKVFGQGGGAYDADYMAAIEDAILLGADSINLSLGSAAAGFTRNDVYADLLNQLCESDTVVVMSMGNNSYWSETSFLGNRAGLGYLYGDDVNFATGGSPGTYTNSLAVASVDNAGSTGEYVVVDDQMVFYLDTGESYGAAPFSSLTGETMEYVLIDGIGTEAQFAAVASEVGLEGKIAICSRGSSSFYEKANAAAANGAAATIIYNNTHGPFGMNLSDYQYKVPCVSVSQSGGQALREAGTAGTVKYEIDGAEETLTYYVGTLTVGEGIGHGSNGDPSYYMSSFSSWGAPGDLSIKPEVTAPGGNIYSVNGTHYDSSVNGILGGTDAYENMSGTSMAAPQVTGMMALLAQYIKENGLKQEGLTVRALAQSLLMSTAVPMIDEDSSYYYPVMQQGAGLANIGEAISADTYILMGEDATDSWADGKVKAELGDDPDKTGEYTFSFTVNNLTGTEKGYTLSANLFTQELSADYDYYLGGYRYYLNTWTTPLDFKASWTVNGKPLELELDAELAQMDFNGDHQVDGDDCTALLEYVTGERDTIYHEDLAASLDGKAGVSTRDAYVFLERMNLGSVTVPAYGSTQVQVTLTLTEYQKAVLDYYYENGAYVEGYINVTGITTEEGVLGTAHSIPMLAFYGNWSDASMFEPETLLDYEYGTASVYPYGWDNNGANFVTNFVGIKYPGGQEEAFLGNPLEGLELPIDRDEDGKFDTLWAASYQPERNAINSDTVLTKLYYTPIRNAYAGLVTLSYDGDTYGYQINKIYSAYLNENTGVWDKMNQSASLDDWNAVGLDEGTYVEVGLTLAPEYYVQDDGTVNWDALGKGANLSFGFTVDNTAPEITAVSMTGADETDSKNTSFVIKAQDNNYVAGVLIFGQNGRELTDGQLLDQTVAADKVSVTFDRGAEENVFLVQVWDYAGNVGTYRVFFNMEPTDAVTSVTVTPETLKLYKGSSAWLDAEVLPINVSDSSVTWTSSNEDVATVREDGLVKAVGDGTCVITATSVQDKEISDVCTVTVESVKTTLYGALQDEDGAPLLFTWDLENDRTWDAYADLENDVCSVAMDYEGMLYQQDSNGMMYQINPDTGETLAWSNDTTAFGAPMMDMDFAYYTYATNGVPLVLGIYENYFLWSLDPMDNTFDYGVALSGLFLNYSKASKLVGLCWGGVWQDPKSGTVYDVLCALDNAGWLWYFIVNAPEDCTSGEDVDFDVIGWDYTDLNLPFPTSSGYQFCSMTMEDSDTLYLSYFTGTTNEIYQLKYDETEEMYVSACLGDVGDGVWPTALFYADSNESEETEGGEADTVERAARTGANAVSLDSAAVKAEKLHVDAALQAPKGGLNSTAVLREEVSTRSAGGYNPWQDTVTVKLTAQDANGRSVASNNGEMTVSYNPASLELVEVQSNAAYSSYVDENGVVTFAYAQLEAIPAGAAVATLKFAVRDLPVGTIHVNHLQVNEDLHVNTTEALYPRVDLSGGNGDITLPILPGFGSGSSASKPTEAMDFTDVSKSDPFYDAVKYVYEEGLMNGTGNGKFSPYGTLTRAMVVTILYRIEGEPSTRYNGMFRDVANYQWYTDAVEWAAKNNIVTGYTSGKFGPEDPVTREQLAAILYRYALSKGSVLPAGNSLTAYADGSNVSSYAVSAVKWAVAEGILEAQNGKLQPRDAANRAQVAIAVAAFHQKYVK